MCELKAPVLHVAEYYLANISLCTPAGLFDNVLSDYLWVRAVLLTGSLSFILGPVPIDESFTASLLVAVAGYGSLFQAYKLQDMVVCRTHHSYSGSFHPSPLCCPSRGIFFSTSLAFPPWLNSTDGGGRYSSTPWLPGGHPPSCCSASCTYPCRKR